MSEQSRAVPDHPSLRYLKLEAKRRLAAGEFTALHEAHLVIAREHGQPSWAALKRLIMKAGKDAGPALARVRWVQERFRGAGGPDWAAPGEDELREHFTEHFLTTLPPASVNSALTGVAERLGQELVVLGQGPSRLRAQAADLRIEAAVEPGPPHRLSRLRMYSVGGRATDARAAAPATRRAGDVPAAAERVAEEAFAEYGLAGLLLAGATGREPAWLIARGWADLERGEELRPDHAFPAYGITKLVTSTAILRLAADGRLALDAPASEFLRTIRLADEAVTVRELLCHTGGVDSPADMFADRPAGAAGLFGGTVVPCGGPRGGFAYSNGGYAVLGHLIADVTAAPYAEAATRLVLEPLGMDRSWFPTSTPDANVISGHRLTGAGGFVPDPARMFRVAAAGGLWTSAADLVRFGQAWSGLLPAELAREAVRPHAAVAEAGAHAGLGWLVSPAKGIHGHPGSGPGAATSLMVVPGEERTSVAHTNRLIPIEPINARLARPVA